MRKGDMSYFDNWMRNTTERGSCIRDTWNRILAELKEHRKTARAKRPVQHKGKITSADYDDFHPEGGMQM